MSASVRNPGGHRRGVSVSIMCTFLSTRVKMNAQMIERFKRNLPAPFLCHCGEGRSAEELASAAEPT